MEKSNVIKISSFKQKVTLPELYKREKGGVLSLIHIYFTNGERQFAGWSLDPKSDTPDYIAEELPEDISTDEYFQLVEDQKVIENTQGIIPEGNYTLLTKENTTYGLNVQLSLIHIYR